MHRLFTMFILALLTATAARGEGLDTLQIYVQQGDSCMQQYNTFEALKHYQQAFDVASKQGVSPFLPLDIQIMDGAEIFLERLKEILRTERRISPHGAKTSFRD